jgi:uncharacterized membrane protein YraQ (UPF0718 family)
VAARLNELIVIFVSIVLQSLPFVLVGVFASAVVQRYLSPQHVARWMPRRALTGVLLGAGFGLVAPVCDCGVVPLARRLVAKGIPLPAAVSLMLAAPVINPIVLVATALAFQGNMGVVVVRAAMTLSVAVSVGMLTGRLFPDARLRLPGLWLSDIKDAPPSRWTLLGRQTAAELFDVLFFIVLGALFTAVVQTFVPRSTLLAFGGQRVGSIAALMPLASLLSICSEADAFVARAFSAAFAPGAVLAFLTIGQVLDLRNGPLLFRTLGGGMFGLIAAVGYGLVFLEGVCLNLLLA